MDRLEQKTDVLTGQVTGIASKLIEIDKRLSVLEMRFESMEHRIASLETEIKQVRQEILILSRKIETMRTGKLSMSWLSGFRNWKRS